MNECVWQCVCDILLVTDRQTGLLFKSFLVSEELSLCCLLQTKLNKVPAYRQNYLFES